MSTTAAGFLDICLRGVCSVCEDSRLSEVHFTCDGLLLGSAGEGSESGSKSTASGMPAYGCSVKTSRGSRKGALFEAMVAIGQGRTRLVYSGQIAVWVPML